MFLEDS